MKKWKMILTAAMPLAMALSFPAFAGEWHEDMNGWWYENDDGSYCRNGWYWIDGDHDGWAQCYYFGNSGYLQMNAGYAQTNTGHADGYEIDKNGAWSVNGVIMAARDWVFQVLRTAIIRGVLPGGMPLRQDEISAQLIICKWKCRASGSS